MDDRDLPGGVAALSSRHLQAGRALLHRGAREARSILGRQVLLLLFAGLVVQLLLPYRFDSAAHVVGGGALVLVLLASAPEEVMLRVGAWADVALMGVVLGVAWATEASVFGPFDLVDIAFTLSGALVVVATFPGLVPASSADRRSLGGAGLVLVLSALAYRYILGIGA